MNSALPITRAMDSCTDLLSILYLVKGLSWTLIARARTPVSSEMLSNWKLKKMVLIKNVIQTAHGVIVVDQSPPT